MAAPLRYGTWGKMGKAKLEERLAEWGKKIGSGHVFATPFGHDFLETADIILVIGKGSMGCCLMVGADDAAALTDYRLQALEFRFNCFRTVDNGKLVKAAPEFQGGELFPYLDDIHTGIDVNGKQTIQSCLQELGNQ